MDKEALNSEAPIESECCISDTEACSKSPGQSRTDLKHNPPELLPAAWLRLSNIHFEVPGDVILVLSRGRYIGHRLAICSQSSVFDSMSCTSFVETGRHRIDVSMYPYQTIVGVFAYLYCGDYMELDHLTEEDRLSGFPTPLEYHANIWVLGGMFMISGLSRLAVEKYKAAAETGWDAVAFVESMKWIHAAIKSLQILHYRFEMMNAIIGIEASSIDSIMENVEARQEFEEWKGMFTEVRDKIAHLRQAALEAYDGADMKMDSSLSSLSPTRRS